jgi:hypothetical protein
MPVARPTSDRALRVDRDAFCVQMARAEYKIRLAGIPKTCPIEGGPAMRWIARRLPRSAECSHHCARRLCLLLSLGLLGTLARTSPAAGLAAQAEITYAQVDAGTYRYSVDLQNTGTTTIGTMWYAWVPGEDFLASKPTNIMSPSGWTPVVTGGTPGDGFAIQWKTSSPIAAGSVLTGFQFDSADTPSELASTSASHSGIPVGTTVVYEGQPFLDPGQQFVTNPVSDPWTNPLNSLDVNQDGLVSPLDALQVINDLNTNGPRMLAFPPVLPNAPVPFLDVSGDKSVSSLDALLVLNALNAPATKQANPLAEPAAFAVSNLSGPSAVPEPATVTLAVLAFAPPLAWITRRRLRRSRALSSQRSVLCSAGQDPD